MMVVLFLFKLFDNLTSAIYLRQAKASLSAPPKMLIVDDSLPCAADDVDTQVHPLMDELAAQFGDMLSISEDDIPSAPTVTCPSIVFDNLLSICSLFFLCCLLFIVCFAFLEVFIFYKFMK